MATIANHECSENKVETPMVIADGRTQIKVTCSICGKFQAFAPQNKPFVFHFGKYSGKKLEDVIIEDASYVEWCIENLTDKKVVDRIKRAIDGLKK